MVSTARRMRSTDGASDSSPGRAGPEPAPGVPGLQRLGEPSHRRLADAEQPPRLRHERIAPQHLLQRAGRDLVLALRQRLARRHQQRGQIAARLRLLRRGARGRPSTTTPAAVSPYTVRATSNSERPSTSASACRSRWPSTAASTSHSNGIEVERRRRRSGPAPAAAAPGRGARPWSRCATTRRSGGRASISSASVGERTGASTAAWQGAPSSNRK